jgi:hypothetical protein
VKKLYLRLKGKNLIKMEYRLFLHNWKRYNKGILDKYKRLYHSFLWPIDLNELIAFKEIISFELYQDFCEEKLEIPTLQVTAFILKNSRHFMTKEILYHFYQLLFENKLSKIPAKVAFCKFKKTKNCANIKFSSLQELNNLINSLRFQLS